MKGTHRQSPFRSDRFDRFAGAALGGLFLAAALGLQAQPIPAPVLVTITLDQPTLARGKSTTLHVFARIRPELSATADRIFSWALNLRDSNGSVAQPDFARLTKPASDNDPDFSGNGSAEGADLFGVYDTFLNRAGAGVGAPVELFSVPVLARATGQATFTVEAGFLPPFAADFLVAPRDGGDPWMGGDYGAATATLQVTSGLDELPPFPVTMVPAETPGQLVLSFPVQAGFDYTVQSQIDPGGANWQPMPGAPHNSGRLVVSTAGAAHLCFRVRVDSQ